MIVGCAHNNERDDTTNIRFFNAVVGIGDVDMLVDADEYLSDVAYLESSDYLEFDTQPHVLQITPSDALTPIDTNRVSLRDDVDYSYIACGNSREPEAILIEDDTEPAGNNSFKARIVNVFKGPEDFDVYVTQVAVDDAQPTVKRLGFKATTQYLAARSGIYDIIVKNTNTGKVATIRSGQEFESENVYSIMLVAKESDPTQVQVLVLTDRNAR